MNHCRDIRSTATGSDDEGDCQHLSREWLQWLTTQTVSLDYCVLNYYQRERDKETQF